MGLYNESTLVINSGNYLGAPTGTAVPVDLTAPEAPWAKFGHTSLEDIFSIASEGGEATVIGTLQNKSLRTKYSARTETMTFTLQQFDEESLKLYFGSNMVVLPDGMLGVPTDATPHVGAFLAVFVDGENNFAFYAPKAEIFRNDDMSLSDTESLAGLPLGVKPMVDGANTWTYAITPLTPNGTATGATSGSPGSFTPTGSVAPADLAELQAEVTATPLTAWTTGQHVVLGDASEAFWNGTAWVVGQAV